MILDLNISYCSSCEKVNVLNHKGFFAKIISKKSADYGIFVKRFQKKILNLMPLYRKGGSP